MVQSVPAIIASMPRLQNWPLHHMTVDAKTKAAMVIKSRKTIWWSLMSVGEPRVSCTVFSLRAPPCEALCRFRAAPMAGRRRRRGASAGLGTSAVSVAHPYGPEEVQRAALARCPDLELGVPEKWQRLVRVLLVD